MHNLPSNNETNIIRNIFNISTNFLNEQVVKTLDAEETVKAMRNAPGLGKDTAGRFRPTADVRQQILMTPTTQVPQPRRTGTDIVKAAGEAATKSTEGAMVKADTKLAATKVTPSAVTTGAAATAKPGLLSKVGKGLVRGVGIPLAVEYGVGKGLEALGMKGGEGQVQTGRGMQPVKSPGALDYTRDAISGAAGAAAMGLGAANVAIGSGIAGWNLGRAIAKKMGVDQEDRNILELGAEALGTSGSQQGRSQQLEKEQAAGEAARRARASDPEFLKKQAADKAARQAAYEEEKAAAAKPAAPAKEFALPASTLKPTENPLAGAASAKSAPAKPAAPVQTSAPASTRTPIMPGSSKEVIKTATSNPTADILKTIQDIVTAPSAAPAKPAAPAVPAAKSTPTSQSTLEAPPEPDQQPRSKRTQVTTQTTSGRETGLGANKTAFQPTQSWEEVARKHIPNQFKNAPLTRKNGKVYAGDVEMTAASQETSHYAETAPTKPISESYYYRRLANLFEETRDSLEDISAKRRERQVKVAGLEGQVNPHGFENLAQGIRNVQAFSGMGGADMPKPPVEKSSENVGERTVAKADQRKALMTIMSASQDHADLKDRFTKEDALNPHSPLHKALVSRNPNLRDESKVMAKYHTGS